MKSLKYGRIYQPIKCSRTFDIVKFVVESRVRLTFQKNKNITGTWMTQSMKNLGPAFIKLGQFFSTRSDIFGKDVTNELSKLQDNTDSESYNTILNILQNEFTQEQLDNITSIEEVPIASASIGQIHRAKLKLKNGTIKDVVIKVQKPRVGEMIRNDILALKNIVSISKFIQTRQSNEILIILDQYDAFISAELDFRSEMKHMQRFRKIFEQTSEVCIPKVYSKYCTEKVIIMEYVPSIKITNIDELKKVKIDTSLQCTRIINAFLFMITEHGYIHCDPHPGNIGVLENGESIVLYDFGNVVQLTKEFQQSIPTILFAIVQQDVDEFLGLLINLKIINIPPNTDSEELKSFFTYFFNYLKTLDLNDFRESIVSNQLLNDVNSNVSFKINNDFLSLFRVFSLLDGTCIKLDPEFNYYTSIQPYTENLLGDMRFMESRMQRDLKRIQSIPTMFRDSDTKILKMNRQIIQTQSTIEESRILMCLSLVVYTFNSEISWIMASCIVSYSLYKYYNKK